MHEVVTIKEECDYCDGCGWYEGGPTIMTTCEKCGGEGFIEVTREAVVNHKWAIGEWKREGRLLEREDECSLCGCRKGSVKAKKEGAELVAYYERSGQIYGWEHMPECWGAKSPS